ncbi:MAG: hypothetical protein JEY97_04490 [Bacteroidales bacterium]|nr:hypothetical protein [Bacteroidales bacterium]
MKKILYTSILVVLFSTIGFAQQNILLYDFDVIPQSSFSNPSVTPKYKLVVGFPGISSISTSYHNSIFGINDLLVKRSHDDSLKVDIGNVISKLDDNNYFLTNIHNDFLFVGFKTKKGFLTVGAYDNFDLKFKYPKELIEFVWYGNADTRFKNKLVDFSNTDFNTLSYIAFHVGYSMPIPNFEKLEVGVRLKYLKGFASVNVEKFDASFFTKPDENTFYSIEGRSDILINTSGVQFDKKELTFSDYFSDNKNNGFAFDLGATYSLNEKIKLSASVLDIGSINWKSRVKNYKSDNANYKFNGIYLDEQNDSTDIWSIFKDSLTEIFHFSETVDSYKTNLPTNFFLGGSYKIDNKSSAGFVFFGRNYCSHFASSFSLSYTRSFTKSIHVKGSYSVINSTYANIGLGLSFNMGPIQAYFVSNNIIGLFAPFDTRQLHFRLGFNVAIFDKEETVLSTPDLQIKGELDKKLKKERIDENKILDKNERKANKQKQKDLKRKELDAQKKIEEEQRLKDKQLQQQRREYKKSQKKKKDESKNN